MDNDSIPRLAGAAAPRFARIGSGDRSNGCLARSRTGAITPSTTAAWDNYARGNPREQISESPAACPHGQLAATDAGLDGPA